MDRLTSRGWLEWGRPGGGHAARPVGSAGARSCYGPGVRFLPGQVAVRRYFRHRDGLIIAHCGRVVSDDERGLLMWTPAGTVNRRLKTVDGQRFDQLTPAEWEAADKVLAEHPLRPYGMLIWMPPAAAHSVGWFFDPAGSFAGWYVNLESPAVRWSAGLDLVDHDLDVAVTPERTWRWKDEDEFEASTREGLDWSEADAAEIRAEGERLVKLVESGDFPFDGSWCDFHPDPSWPLPALPAGWDRPRQT